MTADETEKDKDTIEVPGAEIPGGVDDHAEDPKRAGSPGTLQDLAADAMDAHRHDKDDKNG
jgi:hypothetical protein